MKSFEGLTTYVGKDPRLINYIVDEVSARTSVNLDKLLMDFNPREDYLLAYAGTGQLDYDQAVLNYPTVDIKEFIDTLEQHFPKTPDWSKVPRWTKVLVRDYPDESWKERLFISHVPEVKHPFIVASSVDIGVDSYYGYRYAKLKEEDV